MNSLDPQTTNNNQPYGPIRYKEIVKERWYIAKHSNIPYSDTENITPTERNYILEFISEDFQRNKEAMEKKAEEIKQAHKQQRGNFR